MNLQERNSKIEQFFLNCSDLYDDAAEYHAYAEKVYIADSPLMPEQFMYFDARHMHYHIMDSDIAASRKTMQRYVMLLAHIGATIEKKKFFEQYGNHDILRLMDANWFILTKCWSALKNKGADYEMESDCYANFKESAHWVRITPEQTLKAYMHKQFVVVAKAMESGNYTTLSDSLSERISDIINYLAIYYVMPDVITNQPELPFQAKED